MKIYGINAQLSVSNNHCIVKYSLKNKAISPTCPNASQKFPVGITIRIIRQMLFWKIRGMNKPSAFFKANGEAIVMPKIVN